MEEVYFYFLTHYYGCKEKAGKKGKESCKEKGGQKGRQEKST